MDTNDQARQERLELERRASVARLRERIQREQALQQQAHQDGIEALRRLLPIAQRDTGQSGVIAAFLLSLYNGDRFKFDLTDFRRLDRELFEDCLRVLRMDFQPRQEVHCYFPNGGKLWEQIAVDWNMTDYRLQRIELRELREKHGGRT